MTGNKKLDTILVLMCTLVSLATAGFFYYSEFIFKKPLPNDQAEMEKFINDSKKIVYGSAIKIDKLIINLQSKKSSRLRFLDVETHLVPFKGYKSDEIELKKPLIQDVIINVASNMYPKELNSVTGKVLFEHRVKKGINLVLGGDVIKDIFFSKFVVQ